ncbi:MAG: outer membrane lipoprotein carrier protein LolA [Acidobacteriota bacterium]
MKRDAKLTIRLGLAVALSLGLAAQATRGGTAYDGLPANLTAVLEEFDAAQKDVTSLSAHFVERKEVGLLRNAVVQEGRFYHTKPDKFLWEYLSPEPRMLLMNGKMLVAYYPRQKQAEEIRTRLTRRLVKYFGLGQVFSDLRKYYDLSLSPADDLPGTRTVVMKPKKKSLAKHLLEVRLWLDQKLNQVRRLEYREVDGDRTVYTFDDIQVNPMIAADRFKIDLPEDVTVSDTFSGFFAEKGR